MKTQQLSERIRVEYVILGHARDALTYALSIEPDVETSHQWLERYRFLLNSFGRHIKRLFAIEQEVEDSPAGLVLRRRTTLSDRADRLRAEHEPLLQRIVALLADSAKTFPSNLANLFELRQRALGVLGQLARHQQEESDLWLEALETDIGGEG